MNRENSKAQSIMQNAKPGEIFTFGTYPQTADGVRPALKINLEL